MLKIVDRRFKIIDRRFKTWNFSIRWGWFYSGQRELTYNYSCNSATTRWAEKV